MNKEGLYLRVVELVKKGYSYREVERELGISHGKVGCIMESYEVAERLYGDLLKKEEELEKLRGKVKEWGELSQEAEKEAAEKEVRVVKLLDKEQVLLDDVSGFTTKRRYEEDRYNEFKRLAEDAESEVSLMGRDIADKARELKALKGEVKAKEEERKKLEEICKGIKLNIEDFRKRGMWFLQKYALEVFPKFTPEMRVRMLCTLSDNDLIELIELVRKQRGLPLSWWVPSPLR